MLWSLSDHAKGCGLEIGRNSILRLVYAHTDILLLLVRKRSEAEGHSYDKRYSVFDWKHKVSRKKGVSSLQSLEIPDMIFASNWTPLSNSSKKILLMTMRRAMEPVEFTSYYVVSICLESFKAVSTKQFHSFNIPWFTKGLELHFIFVTASQNFLLSVQLASTN